jgi:transglutaminase-like putative cysteine protease
MYVLESPKPFLPIFRNLKSFLVLAFLTLSLANCGQKEAKHDLSQEFEEPFQTDDISDVPLEEKDLEGLAKNGTQYQLIETPFFIVKEADKKYYGKTETTFSYQKNEKLFVKQKKSEIMHPEKVVTSSMTLSYQSVAPFALLTAESEQTTRGNTVELSHYFLDCRGSGCSLKIKKNDSEFNRSIKKTNINLPNLKVEILPQLIARHQYNMDRIRLSYQAPDTDDIYSTKKVLYVENPTDNDDMVYSEVFKKFFPDKENKSKYTLEKKSYVINRDGKEISSSDDFVKTYTVSKEIYDATRVFAPEAQATWVLIPSETKKIDFVHAIVKGNTRHFLRSTRTQNVKHFERYSEVELLASSTGTPDTKAPTELETTNKKTHYIEPEWQNEIDKELKNQISSEDKALSILKFLTKKIQGTDVYGTLSFKELFDLKRGDCSEFTKSFVLIARENGIAARKHKGYVIPKNMSINEEGLFSHPGYSHAWANYFNPELGEWVLADAALRMHLENKNAYMLDFGVDSPDDIEKEDYLERPELLIQFVFDKASKEKTMLESQ